MTRIHISKTALADIRRIWAGFGLMWPRIDQRVPTRYRPSDHICDFRDTRFRSHRR